MCVVRYYRTRATIRIQPLPHAAPQVKLERVLAVSAAARAKHQRLLRPAFGSADRRDELEELLSLEAARAADARGAMMSYRQELLEEEAAVAREYATKVAACFRDVTAILDR